MPVCSIYIIFPLPNYPLNVSVYYGEVELIPSVKCDDMLYLMALQLEWC